MYDEHSKEFYFYSDELVERAVDRKDRPTKRVKLEPVTSEDEESSRDAYMLVYRRLGTGASAVPRDPPKSIADAIDADNAALTADINGRVDRRLQLAAQFDSVQSEKLTVLKQMPGVSFAVAVED